MLPALDWMESAVDLTTIGIEIQTERGASLVVIWLAIVMAILIMTPLMALAT